MRALYFLLLFPALCFGQGLRSPAFVGSIKAPVSAPSGNTFPSVANLFARYVASDFTDANGTLVSVWTNKVRDSLYFTNGATASQFFVTNNAAVMNGKTFLYAAGANTCMTNGMALSIPTTLFIVAMHHHERVYYGSSIIGESVAASSMFLGWDYTQSTNIIMANQAQVSVGNTIGLPVLYRAVFNDASSSCDTNGVQAMSGTTGGYSSTMTVLHCPHDFDTTQVSYWEIVVITNTVSAGDLTSLNAYFKAEYNLPMP